MQLDAWLARVFNSIKSRQNINKIGRQSVSQSGIRLHFSLESQKILNFAVEISDYCCEERNSYYNYLVSQLWLATRSWCIGHCGSKWGISVRVYVPIRMQQLAYRSNRRERERARDLCIFAVLGAMHHLINQSSQEDVVIEVASKQEQFQFLASILAGGKVRACVRARASVTLVT